MTSDDDRAHVEMSELHWNSVYERHGTTGVSWYQSSPEMSLAIIESLASSKDAAIIDVGGGASVLVPSLLGQGFTDLTVLDVARRALDLSQAQLGPDARRVHWLHQDLLLWAPSRSYDLWHDRAVFHFLVEPASRRRYVDVLLDALALDGLLILGAFAPDGPARCSGRPVARYDSAQLGAVLGSGFVLLDERYEEHRTPNGAVQPFTWATFRRR
jgi:hypothetical protein